MIWLVTAVGLLVAAFGATAGAALITVSRAELTRAVGRRLRGASPSLARRSATRQRAASSLRLKGFTT